MAQETLKVIITADTAEAVKNLQNFINQTDGLKEQMQNIGNVSNQATHALSNLSRVVQDAPYGFMAISNNLNPLLESFQRLSAGAKEAGTSLIKELKSALIGPAGVGLALGVVSAILVKYGKDISNFIDKTLNGTNAINEHIEALKSARKTYIESYTEMYKLGKAFDDFNNGTLSKKDVLEQYNKTLGQVYGTTKDVNEAEKVYRDNTEKYIQATYLRAAADIELKKAAEEAAKAAETSKMASTEFTPMFGQAGGFGAGATPTRALNAQREANKRDRINEINERRKFYEDVAKQLRDEADLIDKTATRTKDFGKEVVKVSNEIKKIPKAKQEKDIDVTAKLRAKQEKDIDVTAELRARYKRDTLLAPMEVAPKDTAIEDAKKEYEDYLKWLSKETKWKEKLAKENIKNEQKDLEELQKSYEKFAETIAGTVTNALFTMYDAIQQGENPLQAIGQMFANIARQIAAAVVQALIFQALLEAFPALKGAFAALGTVNSAFGIGKGMSALNSGVSSSSTFNSSGIASVGNQTNGQFVIKGNDLVLALQRSNSSLNLIRG